MVMKIRDSLSVRKGEGDNGGKDLWKKVNFESGVEEERCIVSGFDELLWCMMR